MAVPTVADRPMPHSTLCLFQRISNHHLKEYFPDGVVEEMEIISVMSRVPLALRRGPQLDLNLQRPKQSMVVGRELAVRCVQQLSVEPVGLGRMRSCGRRISLTRHVFPGKRLSWVHPEN
jgi:hypothetical protein